MKTDRITGTSHPMYQQFAELYNTSFPIYEQRTQAQQANAFADSNYHLNIYFEDNTLIAFIGYWEFDTYLYIEHFAVNTSLRGSGYGSKIITEFTTTHKITILEIDPVIDEISKSRLRFYERAGFLVNTHCHHHPPYLSSYNPHELVVLSTKHKLSETEYNTFASDLKQTVMNIDK